jgi:hypothetical protein
LLRGERVAWACGGRRAIARRRSLAVDRVEQVVKVAITGAAGHRISIDPEETAAVVAPAGGRAGARIRTVRRRIDPALARRVWSGSERVPPPTVAGHEEQVALVEQAGLTVDEQRALPQRWLRRTAPRWLNGRPVRVDDDFEHLDGRRFDRRVTPSISGYMRKPS